MINECSIPQFQETFLCDIEVWTNKPYCSQEYGKRKRYLNRSVYALRVLCDIWLNGIYDQWLRMHRIIWAQMAILKDGLKNIAAIIYDTWRRKKLTERTYRQAECCKESQSKECLHCRCCQKMKNWRQLHVGLIYTQKMSPSSINSTYKTIHFR